MLIVAVFVIGYFFIAIESVTKVNKAAIALLMFVGCWTIFMCPDFITFLRHHIAHNDNQRVT